MADKSTQRVLGTARYEARWVARSLLVKLTASGILPCANYSAQLEQRPIKPLPSAWDMIFYVEPFCLKALKPFSSEVYVPNPNSAKHISVRDATGEHDVPVLPAFGDMAGEDSTRAIWTEHFNVYSLLTEPQNGHVGCFIVPYGALLPAIYRHAFGPASRLECEGFVTEHCREISTLKAEQGHEIPWPLAD